MSGPSNRRARSLPAWELGAFLAAATLFRFYPRIDLDFSSLFYHPATQFYLAQIPLVQRIYHAVPYMIAALMSSSAAVYALNRLLGWNRIAINGRGLAYLALSLLLGPGLLVHGVF